MTKNELVVLGFLSQRPMHGYQLYHEIEKRNMESWGLVNMASIYNTLDRLRRAKMVEAKREKPGKMPERVVFHITAKGKKRLSYLVEDAITDERMPENNFAMGVIFLFGLSKKKALECVEVKKKHFKRILERVEGLKKDSSHMPLNWKFLLRYGVDHLRLEVKKVEELKKTISKMKSWS
jgi:DNA-binding PadR family transcriptional regulator